MSNSGKYPIANPIEYTKRAVYFRVSVQSLVLNESSEITALLFSDIDELLEIRRYILTGQDYTQWQEDQYIIDYVSARL